MRYYRFTSLATIFFVALFAATVQADFSGPYTFAPDEGVTYPSGFPQGVQFSRAVGTWTLSGKIDGIFFTNFSPYVDAVPSEFYFNLGPPEPVSTNTYYSGEISLTHT